MAILRALLLLVVPVLVLIAGGALLTSEFLLKGRRASARAAPSGVCAALLNGKKQHLNLQLCGYGIAQVKQQWKGENGGAANPQELATERRFLLYDLVFPLLYGGALAAALWLAWNDLGRPFAAAWLLAPVVIGVVADWVENLVHLQQLDRFQRLGENALQQGWIQLASWATTLKLSLLGAGFLLLAALSSWLILRMLAARS